MEKDPITQLNELIHIKVDYKFGRSGDDFICTAFLQKDNSVFDCHGKARRKQDAKVQAATYALALLGLLFPTVPMAFFNRGPKLEAEYMPSNKVLIGKPCYYLSEIKSGCILVYFDKEAKSYFVASEPLPDTREIQEIPCPIELLNDPIRFTDWSGISLSIAQENYISKRLMSL